jgi:hypothetical protein
MAIFNKKYWLEQLKKEVGLMDTPYEELYLHEVELDSPTGRAIGLKINAKRYVDTQLQYIEDAYKEHQEMVELEKTTNFTDLDQANASLVLKEIPQLEEKKLEEIKPTNIKFFEVTFDKGAEDQRNFVVILQDDGSDIVKDQINVIKDLRFFIKEKKREELIGNENIISYYQYFNTISRIPRPQKDLTAYEKITQNMDTVFDGLRDIL